MATSTHYPHLDDRDPRVLARRIGLADPDHPDSRGAGWLRSIAEDIDEADLEHNAPDEIVHLVAAGHDGSSGGPVANTDEMWLVFAELELWRAYDESVAEFYPSFEFRSDRDPAEHPIVNKAAEVAHQALGYAAHALATLLLEDRRDAADPDPDANGDGDD